MIAFIAKTNLHAHKNFEHLDEPKPRWDDGARQFRLFPLL
jgi:hypothetical protein